MLAPTTPPQGQGVKRKSAYGVCLQPFDAQEINVRQRDVSADSPLLGYPEAG
jgi:hypothetical protein